jgi:tRNA dimethylallyltransferase
VLPPETILIAGPTGAGKTELSLLLAEHLGGEIVGADAFQLYRGIPLLTAQPPPDARRGIPHHMVGCIDPLVRYDAARWLEEAGMAIREISRSGRRPIVVGGTGLYFKALLGGIQEMPGNDPELRSMLEGLTDQELVGMLGTLDPDAVTQVDTANRRRVVRAIEIIRLTGRPLSESRTLPRPPLPTGVRAVLIVRDKEDLHARIAANVEAMFAAGVVDEVASLPGEMIGPTASGTLGLREIRAHLRGEVSLGECVEAITRETRRYAKRQITWFRNQHDFPEFHPGTGRGREAMEALLGVLQG